MNRTLKICISLFVILAVLLCFTGVCMAATVQVVKVKVEHWYKFKLGGTWTLDYCSYTYKNIPWVGGYQSTKTKTKDIFSSSLWYDYRDITYTYTYYDINGNYLGLGGLLKKLGPGVYCNFFRFR